jgi:dinuclear metal center YbgI/SA1388 family protein
MPAQNPQVADIINIMEQMAPSWLAESWDNVGLLTGCEAAVVKRLLIALEAAPALLEQTGAGDMLLVHHPPIFKPLNNLQTSLPAQAALIKAAARGLNLYAAHTNLDAAARGVNQALADCLELTEVRPLLPASGAMVKLVVFVPPENFSDLSQALFDAGAGSWGGYQSVAFSSPGRGQFMPLPGACPSSGRVGELSRVEEIRLEMLVPKRRTHEVVDALRRHHLYEEPAFDLIPLLNSEFKAGMGRVGNLARPLPGKEFLTQAARKLGALCPLYAGAPPPVVSRVAVLGGAGGFALEDACRARAQVFVSGEAGYHSAQQAEDLGMCLLLVGHYASEALVTPPWADFMRQELAARGFSCQVNLPAAANPWNAVRGL